MCCLRFSGDLVWVDCFVFWGQTREVRQVLFCDLRMLVLCLLYRLVVICLDLQKMKTHLSEEVCDLVCCLKVCEIKVGFLI